MLVLTRKLNQSIVINNNIAIKVIEIKDGNIKLGINAPKEIPIFRQEIFEEIQTENKRAAQLPEGFDLKGLLPRRK